MSDKRPDRYDEKVAELYPDLNPRTAEAIADFGREAAAEAYEDAASTADGFWVNMPGQSRGKALGDVLRAKAGAAQRGEPKK